MPRRSLLLAGLLALGACLHRRAPPQRIQIDGALPMATARTPVDEGPRIVSAHFGVADAAPLDGRDGIPVVFDVEVDAASLRPEVFWVSLEDGSRVRATEALLSPASENDENRTVLVVGEFGGPTENIPLSVAVYGRLFAEDGRSLDGLAADVAAFDTPGTVVAAERVAPSEGRCRGAPAAIRTYWIDGLRGVQVGDLARVHLTMDDGRAVTPVAFDDHDVAHEAREDNVLDLCLDAPGRAVRLEIEAETFTDPAGHPSGAVDVEIGDAVEHAV